MFRLGRRRLCYWRPVLGLALLLVLLYNLSGCAALTDRGGRSADGFVKVRVQRVIDGDTFVVEMPGGTSEKLRLIGVDTPEISKDPEPFGLEATAYAAERLTDRIVLLETDIEARDRYGRILGYVWLDRPASPPGDGDLRRYLFNAHLLLDGYAQLMTVPPNVKYVEFFREFQAEARENGRGLWQRSP